MNDLFGFCSTGSDKLLLTWTMLFNVSGVSPHSCRECSLNSMTPVALVTSDKRIED
jgi:hypothetical protein